MTDNKYSQIQYSFGETGQAVAHQYSSPFPAPQVLKEYEAIIPGSASEILAIAKTQIEHRQQMERLAHEKETSVIENEFKTVRRGQYTSFIIVVVALAAATYLISIGKSIEGIGAILTALGIIIGAILFQKKADNKK